MNIRNHTWVMGLIGGLCLLVLWSGCKGEEKDTGPAPETKVAEMNDMDPAGLCPQARGTAAAPEPFSKMTNILPASEANLASGKQLFHQDVRPITCETCHGFKGNGFGVIFQQMKPYPRDFTCYQTMKEISDGQLFWIIRHGSHGTRMKPFESLKEDEVWQLAHYVRHFSDR